MRLKKEELATLVILACALVAIGALYLASLPSGQYSWSSADGDHVTVTGALLSKEKTQSGGHIILSVKTDSGPLSVFVPASSDGFDEAQKTEPGKEITVTGKVQTYKGEKELVAESIKEK